jgi:FMN phosphatase YigB (HAD superfamily)
MILTLFDLGGTLINDPFPDALDLIRASTSVAPIGLNGLSESTVEQLLEAWKRENAAFNFPLASHFLQEEVWIIRALRAIVGEAAVDPGDLPLVAARLLVSYRSCAREVIASQKQLPDIKRSLETLLKHKVTIGVASNDRDFATKSMLSWAGLTPYFQWVFTSEGLSSPTQTIEKPQELFFQRVEETIAAALGPIAGKIYVGDHELNDVEIPNRLGYTTIRFFNKKNPADATWLDNRTKTQAAYFYDDPMQLPDLLNRILRDISKAI